jgi:DeoR/GlpR family transcriptional regulator of sugar metabolism
MAPHPESGGAPARRESILQNLRRSGFTGIAELSAQLQVSSMTIRRDLRVLADRGEIRIVRGGASLPPGARNLEAFQARAIDRVQAKRAIGQRAAELVAANDTIAIDAGTTAYQLAQALPASFAGSVITASVPVIQLFLHRPQVHVIALGGDVFAPSEAFVGPMTVESAANLKAHAFFLGAAAIDQRGIYVSADVERPTKQALLDIADEVILLCDRGKFEGVAPIRLCGLDRLDAMVTDHRPEGAVAEQLRAHQVALYPA